MGIVVSMEVCLPKFSLRAKQPAEVVQMPAKPHPENRVISATVAVDLRFSSGRRIAVEGTKVMVEVDHYGETFWIYDQEMRDIIYTINSREKLFFHLDIDEEGLDVISTTGGIRNTSDAT